MAGRIPEQDPESEANPPPGSKNDNADPRCQLKLCKGMMSKP